MDVTDPYEALRGNISWGRRHCNETIFRPCTSMLHCIELTCGALS